MENLDKWYIIIINIKYISLIKMILNNIKKTSEAELIINNI